MWLILCLCGKALVVLSKCNVNFGKSMLGVWVVYSSRPLKTGCAMQSLLKRFVRKTSNMQVSELEEFYTDHSS